MIYNEVNIHHLEKDIENLAELPFDEIMLGMVEQWFNNSETKKIQNIEMLKEAIEVRRKVLENRNQFGCCEECTRDENGLFKIINKASDLVYWFSKS